MNCDILKKEEKIMADLSKAKGTRENLGSRLGFVLISAGCAIGLGNVWRFPYIVSKNGGAAFILIYLLFLVIFGIPIMSMEFAVGRASGKSIAGSFRKLEPKGTKWHIAGDVSFVGNYLLMMYYTVITGWMFVYFYKSLAGVFQSLDSAGISAQLTSMQANPLMMLLVTIGVVALGFFICSMGLKNGVEKVTKVMMLMLLGVIILLAIYICTLPGAGEGIKAYLVPDFTKIFNENFFSVLMDAMGQAFFTLSIGVGSMAIFGSYLKKDRKLFGESIVVASLDTFVAFAAGFIIIPACTIFGVGQDGQSGPGLIFETLPNIFNQMYGGRIVGGIFFLFMIFAAMSTVIGVFENIIAYSMERWGWSRRKACLLNFIIMSLACVPCVLGFNILSGFTPFGPKSNIMDLEDFIVSQIMLPLGSLVYVLFCTLDKKGWGWNNYLSEVNIGKGIGASNKFKVYFKYILPLIIVFLFVQGMLAKIL